MSFQRLVTLLCTIAAIAWVGFEAVRFHREEVVSLTGFYWVLSGERPLVVGNYERAFVWIPPGLNWSDFNRAVDAEASEKIIFFLSQIYDDEHNPTSVRRSEYAASDVAFVLRRDARAELYSLYRQDEQDDRAEAWSKVSDRAVRAFVPALGLFAFAGAMWWALAGFDKHGRSRSERHGFVRLWLVLSVAWVFSYAVLVPLLGPPGPTITIHAHGRRGYDPIELRAPRIGRDAEQEMIAWVTGLLIVPVILVPLLAAYDAASGGQSNRSR